MTPPLPVPLLLATSTPPEGLLIPVTGPGGLAGVTLLGVDGPALTVEIGQGLPVTYTPANYPVTLVTDTLLRLTRTDDRAVVTVLRVQASSEPPPPGDTPFTVQTDSEGYQTLPEGEVITDADGYQTITNGAATPDPDGFETVERSTP